jgi:hypothetical protein
VIGKSLSIAASLAAALSFLYAGSSVGADPPLQAPQAPASIVFTKDTSIQYYWIVKKPGCGSLFGDKLIKIRGDDSASDPVEIEDGKELNLLAIAKYSVYMCPSIATFVPEIGHVYDVKQSIVDQGCRFDVVDRATGRRPSSYVSRSPSDVCPLRWPKILQVRPRR